MLVAAGFCFVHFHEETLAWVARSAAAGGALMSIEAYLRWRNGGERNVACRILVVLSCIIGAPALLAAFFVGGPVIGIGMGVIGVLAAIVALVKWIAKGES
jgi:hypothetical protein